MPTSEANAGATRSGDTLEDTSLAQGMRRHLFFSQAKSPSLATRHDHFMALSLAVRDRLLSHWVHTAELYTQRRDAPPLDGTGQSRPGPVAR
jgi:glycogen phosphorylase